MASTNSKQWPAQWAKLAAFDHNKYWYDQLKEFKTEQKLRFRGPVPEDDLPPHLVTVDWPEDLCRSDPPITPRDVFGNKLQALDPIRMDDEVFISLRPNVTGKWSVEIRGYDTAHVETAKQHYLTMTQKARNQLHGMMLPTNIILDIREGHQVEMQRAEMWWPNRYHKVIARLIPLLINEPGGFRQDPIHFTVLETIHDAIRTALDGIRYEKGTYGFAVHFGCLAVSRGSKPIAESEVSKKYSTTEFTTAINGKGVTCEVKQWLDRPGSNILTRLMTAKHLLEPTGFGATNLQGTRPIFRGTWIFLEPNCQNSSVVQVDWTNDEGGMYEKMTPRFYSLKGQLPKENMDINLLELGEGKAWHFGLESMNRTPRKKVSPVLLGFAERVAMKPGYDMSSDQVFATWDNSIPRTRLISGRLDKIYLFGIRKTAYQVEAMAMWYLQAPITRPVWGLSVRHSEWASHLAELETLLPGCEASWETEATMSTFFPDNGLSSTNKTKKFKKEELGMGDLNLEEPAPWGGIQLFATKLMQLSEVINGRGIPEADTPPKPASPTNRLVSTGGLVI